MNPVPQHRTLLGVDVIGSAQLPRHLLEAVPGTISKLVCTALASQDISLSDALSVETPGDGTMLVLPSEQLGAVVDAAVRLDQLTIEHNRWHKPEVRLRVAVHVGPVGPDGGFYQARITHGRLLDAPEFKRLLERCRSEGDEESASTALIISPEALDTAFGGNHTRLARRGEFAALPVSNKEFRQEAWVRVPGFDARSLAGFATAAPKHQARTVNVVNGDMHGIQADTVNGGVRFYGGKRS